MANDCETCGGQDGNHETHCIWHPLNVRIRQLEQDIIDLKNPNKWPRHWRGKIPFDGGFILKVGKELGLEGKGLGKFLSYFKDQPVSLQVKCDGTVSFIVSSGG